MPCDCQPLNASDEPGMGEKPCPSRLLASNKCLTIALAEHKMLPSYCSPKGRSLAESFRSILPASIAAFRFDLQLENVHEQNVR